MKITPEEKTRWKPIFQKTWDYIAYDAIQCCGGTARRGEVVEFVCDANRLRDIGGITREEEAVIIEWYDTPSFKKWVREEVFPCGSYVI